MSHFLPSGLGEVLGKSDVQMSAHSTLELLVDLDSEFRSYYFATARLDFNGVIWQPQLRKGDEITFDLTSDGDEAVLEIQNVDTLLGIEFLEKQKFISGAEAVVGRYWKDLERGNEWHDVVLTGCVTKIAPNERVLRLTVVPDVYFGSVGPLRFIRGLCTVEYKSFECGRPLTDPPTCDLTLHGAGGCDGRWGSTNKFIRHAGAPFQDTLLQLKII